MESLGYFWNNIFHERKTVEGLTFAQAEQVVQQYYALESAVQSLSADRLPVFDRIRRFPLIIRDSELSAGPPVFGDGTTWGQQASDADPLFANQTFKFGRPKTNNSGVTLYYWKAPAPLKSFSLIADKLVKPVNVFVNNVDVLFNAGLLAFKTNPFSLFPATPLFNQDGTPAMFADANNIVKQDSIIVLWAYEADVDSQLAAVSFGWLFGVFKPSSATYSQVLRSLLKLYTNGASVNHLKAAVAAFLGVKPVVEDGETVISIYTYTPAGFNQPEIRVVETDRNVYTADSYFQTMPAVKVGAKLEAGDVLFDVVEYYDVMEDPTWWQTKVVPKISRLNVNPSDTVTTRQMSFSPSLFVTGVTGELTFKNDIELFTQDSSGGLHFPVEGSPADVARFNAQLNLNSDAITTACGLTPGGSVTVNPLDFLFNNFLKTGTALVKVNFKSVDQAELFTSTFKQIKDALPRNVLFIFFLDFNLPADSYQQLNGSTSITLNGSPATVNSDGTNQSGKLAEESAPNYRTNPKTRLFALSKGVTTAQLRVVINSGSLNSNDLLVKDGAMLTNIPSGKTTREVNNLLLMNLA